MSPTCSKFPTTSLLSLGLFFVIFLVGWSRMLYSVLYLLADGSFRPYCTSLYKILDIYESSKGVTTTYVLQKALLDKLVDENGW